MSTILLVGAGHMGGAMLRGWMAALGPDYSIIALDPNAGPSLMDIPRQSDNAPSFVHYPNVTEVPENLSATAIVLTTKPQMVPDALRALEAHVTPETLIISVAAGVTVATVKSSLKTAQPVVRTMPNIGAAIGRSASAAYHCADVIPAQKALTDRLFYAVGSLIWLEQEEDLHTVTAISGPAYFFAMCEAMIAAVVKHGLTENAAQNLILATIDGAAALLRETPVPAALRKTVTSPNGTTAAALDVLNRNQALGELVTETVAAARNRSQELAAEKWRMIGINGRRVWNG